MNRTSQESQQPGPQESHPGNNAPQSNTDLDETQHTDMIRDTSMSTWTPLVQQPVPPEPMLESSPVIVPSETIPSALVPYLSELDLQERRNGDQTPSEDGAVESDKDW